MASLKKTSIFALLLLIASLSAASLTSQPAGWKIAQFTNEEESVRLHHLFTLYWDWRMDEYPNEATYLGYPGNHGQWPDLSQGGINRRYRFTQELLGSLDLIETGRLNEEDKVSLNILQRQLNQDLTDAQYGSHYLLVDQMDGIHLAIPFVLTFMPANSVQDYENIIERLRRLPVFLKQITDLLDEGLDLGITPPQIAIRGVPQQILNQITGDPFESPFLKSFKQFPETLDKKTQSRLIKEARLAYEEHVHPSLIQFHTFISNKYVPGCRTATPFEELPGGREWYEHKARSSTTTTLTPLQIHEMGLLEVERIQSEMQKVIKSVGFKGTFHQFLRYLKTDKQFFFSTREEILTEYQSLTRRIEAKLPLLFNQLPSLPFKVIPVPSYSEESQAAAYYFPGSIADNRPGYFFINTSHPELRAKWEMEPLALHEAVPGHHLQITLAQELKDIPEFRKNANFTSYIEGWGLYAESLGSEFGLYQDPYSTFGRLTYEMLRAIRLVVDTGLHVMEWTREDAIHYFKQYVGMSDHEITTEVDRYLVMPGQALAYKIGELKIKEMRQSAAEKLGDKFDIREFHNAWLQHGTVPLDIAEQQIHDWIEQLLLKEEGLIKSPLPPPAALHAVNK